MSIFSYAWTNLREINHKEDEEEKERKKSRDRRQVVKARLLRVTLYLG